MVITMTTYISNLKCNGCAYPMTVDIAPRFTFELAGTTPLFMQAHIYLANDSILVWESDIIPYSTFGINSNAQLTDRTAYEYTITIISKMGAIYISPHAFFETGFVGMPFPNARFIGVELSESPIIYCNFNAPETIVSARLYVATLGFSELYIDSEPISENTLSPVWSDYHKRNLTDFLYPINDNFSYSYYYKCYDVTEYIGVGEHTLAVWLGNGWYHQDQRNVEGMMNYGTPKVKFSLYFSTDNEEYSVHSSSECNYDDSPILFNNVYFGEEYDANLYRNDLLATPSSVRSVQVYDDIESVCRGQLCPDDIITETLLPRLCYKCTDYSIYDLKVNLAGRPVITTSAKKGTKIIITLAEEWDGTSELCYDSSGGESQIQTITYHSNGEKDQTYTPHFTVYGFRYIKIVGEIEYLLFDEIHADVELVGSLETSSEPLNKFVSCFINSQRSNLHSGVPSDCPHRERLGYTGDGWITANSACHLFDMEAFYEKWIQDIADSQCTKSGHVSHTAPFYGGGGGPGGWGGAMIFLPFIHYKHYHNTALLERHFDSMVHWLKYLENRSENYIITREEEGGWCLGDWCVPGNIKLSEPFVNTCLYALQLETMANICVILQKNLECAEYLIIRKLVQRAIISQFKNDDGTWDCNEQGAFLFAWKAGVVSGEDILPELSLYANKDIDTGIFGTPFLFEALFKNGKSNIAIDLLSRENYPSFGWMFDNDATTLWESFDGKNSHNHPMFGGAVGVIFDALIGLTTLDDGRIELRPLIPRKLAAVDISTSTPWGEIRIKWKKKNGALTLRATLPVGLACDVNPITN